jgi:hypothetical protein
MLYTKFENMFILIIATNKVLKFNMLGLVYGYFTFLFL